MTAPGGHDGAGGVGQGVDGLAVVEHVVPLPEELEPLLEGVEEVFLDLVAVPAATVQRAEGGRHRPRDPLRRRLRVKPRRRWSRDLTSSAGPGARIMPAHPPAASVGMIGGGGAARLDDAWVASTAAARHAPADHDVLGERPRASGGPT